MTTNTAFVNSSSPATRIGRSRARTIALWSAQIFAAALFLLAGSSKLAGAPAMVGAVITHLFVIGGNPAPALVLLVITTAIFAIRWRDR